MRNKTIVGLITFILFCFTIIYFLSKAKNNLDYFTKNEINAKIIKVYNYENKSLEFYYTKNYCITTTDTKGDTLVIGDSIQKEKNTIKFSVFRKNKYNKYELFNAYEASGL